MVLVVDMHMGWVRKKLLMTLPTLLHGVSTQCVETLCKRIGDGVTYLLRGVCVEMEGGGGSVVMVLVVDIYMGWVKKKPCMTLPALLHGVST